MNVSVISYVFHGLLAEGEMDIFGYMETCKYRYHLEAADIWNGLLVSTEQDYLQKVRDALDERELVLADLAVDRAHVWDAEAAARERNRRSALAHLQAAVTLGARSMRVESGGTGDTWSDEQFDLIVQGYQEHAQFAHDHGFKVGAEVHWGPERLWANMKQLYEAVGHPGFGISCHVGGWLGTEE